MNTNGFIYLFVTFEKTTTREKRNVKINIERWFVFTAQREKSFISFLITRNKINLEKKNIYIYAQFGAKVLETFINVCIFHITQNIFYVKRNK